MSEKETIIDLEQFTDNELIEELEERGHKIDQSLSDFDIDDLVEAIEAKGYYASENEPEIGDFSINRIIKHLEKEKCIVLKHTNISDYLSNLPTYKLKDILCDMVGVNHHTSKQDLLTAIGEKL